jgi:hypothetical protein
MVQGGVMIRPPPLLSNIPYPVVLEPDLDQLSDSIFFAESFS